MCSALSSLDHFDLVFEGVGVRKRGLSTILLLEHSVDVVESRDEQSLCKLRSKLELVLDGNLDFEGLLRDGVSVVNVDLGHIHLNVLFNIGISENHHYLSLSSFLVHDVTDDVVAQDEFGSVLEGEVHEDFLDLIELV